MSIKINKASADDYMTVFTLTKELIEYHNAMDIFELTPNRLRELIEEGSISSYVACYNGEIAGLLNFFWKYTTFTGRKIMYIEDLYVREQFRGCGIGIELMKAAKKIAAENDCEHIELKCSDWNTSSAAFYERIGMVAESEWITYTLNNNLF